MNDFSVTILGSNSALPAHNRHPSAQIIRINQSLILMDCGEGTQFRLKKLRISPMKIRTICISHLHGDHVYGLPGLLTSFILLRRTEPLVLIGPSGIRDFIYAVFSSTYTTLPYPLEIIETDTLHFGQVYETEDFSIFNIPLVHSIPCNGYLFKSKQGTANIKKELINEYHLDVEEIKRLKANTSVRREGLWPRLESFFRKTGGILVRLWGSSPSTSVGISSTLPHLHLCLLADALPQTQAPQRFTG